MAIAYWEKLIEQDKLYRWGVFPGRYFYIADFFEAAYRNVVLPAEVAWPPCLGLFVDEQMLLVLENSHLGTAGRALFEQFLQPNLSKSLVKKLQQSYSSLKNFLYTKNFDQLAELTRDELIAFGELMYHHILSFWSATFPLELANYAGKWFLQSEVKVAPSILLDLIFPNRPTFYQREEAELSKTTDIASHQARYFWLQNSYWATKVLPISFFVKRKRAFGEVTHTHAKMVKSMVRQQKEQIYNKNVSLRSYKHAIETLSYGLWLQEERKQYIWQLQHFKNVFLRQAAKYIGCKWQALLNFSFAEILDFLRSKSLAARSVFSVACELNQMKILSANTTQGLWQSLTHDARSAADIVVGKVLIPGAEATIVGMVVNFNPSLSAKVYENKIVQITHFNSTHVNKLRKSKAILIAHWQSLSHSLFTVLAELITQKNKRCVLVVIDSPLPTAPDTLIYLNTKTGSITKQIISTGTVVSRSATTQLLGEILYDHGNQVCISTDLKYKVVVVKSLTVDKVLQYRSAAAIVAEYGGITCHGAIICRELGIPCITGIKQAYTLLQNVGSVSLNFETGKLSVEK